MDGSKQRSAGVSPAKLKPLPPQPGQITIRNRGYTLETPSTNAEYGVTAGETPALQLGHRPLPHWETDGGTYFVTFRLHDSVPESLRQEVAERKALPLKLPKDKRPSVKEVEAYLDRSNGACYLREPAVAEIVANAVQHLNGKDYRLIAWVVMPNHVHLVFKMLPDRSLSKAMHSLKSFTAKESNRVLGRSGPFWQREYYDRLIRDDAELERAVYYVRSNPLMAGLVDWKWLG